ncbi:MAG: hypothetical protein PHQ96_08105 [Candidatus Omnitrophica bacterium]|nr:hypothetical protein [Candidatus Omnitrophota bacterium]
MRNIKAQTLRLGIFGKDNAVRLFFCLFLSCLVFFSFLEIVFAQTDWGTSAAGAGTTTIVGQNGQDGSIRTIGGPKVEPKKAPEQSSRPAASPQGSPGQGTPGPGVVLPALKSTVAPVAQQALQRARQVGQDAAAMVKAAKPYVAAGAKYLADQARAAEAARAAAARAPVVVPGIAGQGPRPMAPAPGGRAVVPARSPGQAPTSPTVAQNPDNNQLAGNRSQIIPSRQLALASLQPSNNRDLNRQWVKPAINVAPAIKPVAALSYSFNSELKKNLAINSFNTKVALQPYENLRAAERLKAIAPIEMVKMNSLQSARAIAQPNLNDINKLKPLTSLASRPFAQPQEALKTPERIKAVAPLEMVKTPAMQPLRAMQQPGMNDIRKPIPLNSLANKPVLQPIEALKTPERIKAIAPIEMAKMTSLQPLRAMQQPFLNDINALKPSSSLANKPFTQPLGALEMPEPIKAIAPLQIVKFQSLQPLVAFKLSSQDVNKLAQPEPISGEFISNPLSPAKVSFNAPDVNSLAPREITFNSGAVAQLGKPIVLNAGDVNKLASFTQFKLPEIHLTPSANLASLLPQESISLEFATQSLAMKPFEFDSNSIKALGEQSAMFKLLAYSLRSLSGQTDIRVLGKSSIYTKVRQNNEFKDFVRMRKMEDMLAVRPASIQLRTPTAILPLTNQIQTPINMSRFTHIEETVVTPMPQSSQQLPIFNAMVESAQLQVGTPRKLRLIQEWRKEYNKFEILSKQLMALNKRGYTDTTVLANLEQTKHDLDIKAQEASQLGLFENNVPSPNLAVMDPDPVKTPSPVIINH